MYVNTESKPRTEAVEGKRIVKAIVVEQHGDRRFSSSRRLRSTLRG